MQYDRRADHWKSFVGSILGPRPIVPPLTLCVQPAFDCDAFVAVALRPISEAIVLSFVGSAYAREGRACKAESGFLYASFVGYFNGFCSWMQGIVEMRL